MNPRLRFPTKLISLLCICVAGCAPSKTAIYLDPSYPELGIDVITLLPAIDARVDTTEEVNVQEQIREKGKDKLEGKGYEVTLSDITGNAGQITEDLLKSGDSQWIERLGPPEARWTMVLMLVDVSTKLTFGSTGNAEVVGYLFDREKGTIVWRDKGIGKVGQGGLLGMVLKGAMDEEAISEAMNDLMSSFPKRQSRNKTETGYLNSVSTPASLVNEQEPLNEGDRDSLVVAAPGPSRKDEIAPLQVRLAPESSRTLIDGDISVVYFPSEVSKSMLAFRGIAGVNANLQGPFTVTYVEIEANDTFYIKTSSGILYRAQIVQEDPKGVTLSIGKM
jgi:hypothetical protein